MDKAQMVTIRTSKGIGFSVIVGDESVWHRFVPMDLEAELRAAEKEMEDKARAVNAEGAARPCEHCGVMIEGDSCRADFKILGCPYLGTDNHPGPRLTKGHES